MADTKHRVELIDIAKAITIFFVIFGHTVGNLDTPAYRLMIYAFHMPLFFLLAGMSMRLKPMLTLAEWKDYLIKNVMALIVPYFIWGMIYAQTPYAVSVPALLFGSWEGLVRANTLTSLWFLPCFFVARMLVEGMVTFIHALDVEKKDVAYGLCVICLFAFGVILPHPADAGNFWCADVAFVGAAFVLLGNMVRIPLFELAQQTTKRLVLLLVGSLLLFGFGTVGRLSSLGLTNMCMGQYINPFWFLWNALSGSMAVLALSMLIFRFSREGTPTFSTKAITFVGQRTMGIFLLHKQVLWFVVMPALQVVIGFMPLVIVSFVGTVIMLPLSCVMCMVVERFVPQLLGQFPRR